MVKEILVGMDGKDIWTLNLNEVLVVAVVVLVEMAVMPQVQVMDPPMDIPIHNMDSTHFGMEKVELVVLVDLFLNLDLLI